MKTIVFKADEELIYFLNYEKIGELYVSVLDLTSAIECEKVTGEPASNYGFSEDVVSLIRKIDTESVMYTYDFGLDPGIYEIEGTYKCFYRKNMKSDPQFVSENKYPKSILFVDKDKNAIRIACK